MKREEFEKKLKAYAAAAAGVVAAAPAGVMLGASPAEAAVQCSNQTITVDWTNAVASIDLNNDGVVDFVISYSEVVNGEEYGLYINPTTSGGIGGVSFIEPATDPDPARLASGYSIRNNLNTALFSWDNESYDTLAFYSTIGGGSTDGSFVGQRGYIGVRFTSAACNGGNYLYGWIDFEGDSYAQVGTIRGWAYEDNCNQPIQAGATCATSVPTLNQWGLLAMIGLLAGGGALALRRREAEE
jgi:hypothetical protein